jgi:GNAT superfamily N-acetyltransferase
MLTDFTPSVVIQAIETNMQEITSLVRILPGAEVYDTPEMLRTCTTVPFPLLNSVTRTELSESNPDAQIVATLDYFRERQAPMSWWVTPSSRPTDLAARLTAHGVALSSATPGMAADLHTLPDSLSLPPSAAVKEVENEEDLEQWMQAFNFGDTQRGFAEAIAVIARGVGYGAQSSLRCFVALLDGVPVGTSLLYQGSEVAGLYAVGVVPPARRQGLGAGVTLAALLAAREAGYRIGVLQASEMGEPVYRRLGFADYCRFALYIAYGNADSTSRSA